MYYNILSSDIMMATASNYTYDLTPSESELLIAEANLNELNKTRMLLIVSNEKLLDRLMLLLSDAMTVSEKVPRETNNFINKVCIHKCTCCDLQWWLQKLWLYLEGTLSFLDLETTHERLWEKVHRHQCLCKYHSRVQRTTWIRSEDSQPTISWPSEYYQHSLSD